MSSLAQRGWPGGCPGKRPQTPLQAAVLVPGKGSAQDKPRAVSSPCYVRKLKEPGLLRLWVSVASIFFVKRVAERQGMQICFHTGPS